MLRKDDNDWVKCMEYEVVGSIPRGKPKRTWLEVVQRDCKVRGLSKDDAMVRGRWRKMIRMVDEQKGCEWMDVSSGSSFCQNYFDLLLSPSTQANLGLYRSSMVDRRLLSTC